MRWWEIAAVFLGGFALTYVVGGFAHAAGWHARESVVVVFGGGFVFTATLGLTLTYLLEDSPIDA